MIPIIPHTGMINYQGLKGQKMSTAYEHVCLSNMSSDWVNVVSLPCPSSGGRWYPLVWWPWPLSALLLQLPGGAAETQDKKHFHGSAPKQDHASNVLVFILPGNAWWINESQHLLFKNLEQVDKKPHIFQGSTLNHIGSIKTLDHYKWGATCFAFSVILNDSTTDLVFRVNKYSNLKISVWHPASQCHFPGATMGKLIQ